MERNTNDYNAMKYNGGNGKTLSNIKLSKPKGNDG